MKLIKLTHESFKTPCVERVTSLFPRDNEALLAAKYILVSDVKFRQLQMCNIKMYVYASYNEPPRHDLTNLLKDEYYIVTEIIDPSVKTPAQVNIDNYNFGDVLFFHADPPIAPVKPIKPKFHSGTFNYELTEAEKKLLIEKYEEDLAQYEEDLETFKEDFKTFMETKGSLPSYNAIAIIVDPSVKVVADADTEAEFRMYTGKKLWVAMSAKFETTKDEPQFKLYGKLPKEMGTLVTIDAGGIKSGESLKGNTFEQILVRAFGLEFEPEVVGTIQPEGATGMSIPKTSYSSGNALGNPTDSATITTTLDLKLPLGVETSDIKVDLINSKTSEVVSSKSISTVEDDLSFNVTMSDLGENPKTTALTIKAYNVNDESIVYGSSSATVKVKIVKPVIKSLVANPSVVRDKVTSVTFDAAIEPGSAEITSVTINNNNMTPGDTIDLPYTYTAAAPVSDTDWEVVVTDANGSVSKTIKISIVLNKPSLVSLKATKKAGTLNTFTIEATVNKNNTTINQVDLYDGGNQPISGLDGMTETSEGVYTYEDTIDSDTTYSVKIFYNDEITPITPSTTAQATFTQPKPKSLTLTASPSEPTSGQNVTFTVGFDNTESATITKVVVFKGNTEYECEGIVSGTTVTVENIEAGTYKARVYYGTGVTKVDSSASIEVNSATEWIYYGNIQWKTQEAEEDQTLQYFEANKDEFIATCETKISGIGQKCTIHVQAEESVYWETALIVPHSYGLATNKVTVNGFQLADSDFPVKGTTTINGIFYDVWLGNSSEGIDDTFVIQF